MFMSAFTPGFVSIRIQNLFDSRSLTLKYSYYFRIYFMPDQLHLNIVRFDNLAAGKKTVLKMQPD